MFHEVPSPISLSFIRRTFTVVFMKLIFCLIGQNAFNFFIVQQVFALLSVVGVLGMPLDDLTPAAQMIFRPIFLYRQNMAEISKRLEKRKTMYPSVVPAFPASPSGIPPSPAEFLPPSPSVVPASPAEIVHPSSGGSIPAQPALLAQNPYYPPPSLYYNYNDGRYYYYYSPNLSLNNSPQQKH
jgi:hypothetical protein